VTTLGSVIVPAWNESAVIGRTLDALFQGVDPDQLEVIVACNGCSDGTEDVVRQSGHPVRLLELGPVGKARAIQAAEETTDLLPRLYLDADTELVGPSAIAVLERLRAGAVAARPPVELELRGASWLVRAYYAVRADVPSIVGQLYGAGVYGLSATARSRFGTFPEIVADDLFAARVVDSEEVEIVDCPPVTVRVPLRSRSLVSTLARVHRGNRELAELEPDRARSTARGTLSEVLEVGRTPQRIPQVAAYIALTATGRALSHRASRSWERDDTARGLAGSER
jgi:glycosyltransferase involved in cell wall biosynthesis